MVFNFEKLLVYQKAVDFADRILESTERFTRAYGFLVDQLHRAALSIAANIAERTGSFSKPNRRIFSASAGTLRRNVGNCCGSQSDGGSRAKLIMSRLDSTRIEGWRSRSTGLGLNLFPIESVRPMLFLIRRDRHPQATAEQHSRIAELRPVTNVVDTAFLNSQKTEVLPDDDKSGKQ